MRRAIGSFAKSIHAYQSIPIAHSSVTAAPANVPAYLRCLASSVTGKASILDGKALAVKWEESLKAEAAELTKQIGRKPWLAVVMAGERPDSEVYVQRKQDACEAVGIKSTLHTLPANVNEADVQTIVEQLSNDINIDGILLQLPLPQGIKEENVLDRISQVKDVDGLSPVNAGRLLIRGRLPAFSPCPALACIQLLKRSNIPIRNKQVVVLGDSGTVGLPLAVLFRDEGASAVTICHRVAYEAYQEEELRYADAVQRAKAQACAPRVPGDRMYNDGPDLTAAENEAAAAVQKPNNKFLPEITRTADILVVAVGHPELVKKDWVKPGAVVLDVGINVQEPAKEGGKHRLVGDVAFDEVSEVASAISPVPRGVGPMTISALLHNTLEATRRHAQLLKPFSSGV